MDSTDFNAENYDIEELVAILKFEYMPINPGKIKQRINELKVKFKGKKQYVQFFQDAEERLIAYFNKKNKETWKDNYERDDTLASQLLTQQYLDIENDYNKDIENDYNKKNLIVNVEKNIVGIQKLSENEKMATVNTVQGNKNPIKIREIKRIINFDSHYRKILNPDSTACDGDLNANSEQRLYTPTNYTVNLNVPLSNIIDLTLDSVEIPNSWYVFSGDYGTNHFQVDISGNSVTQTITILDGNYTVTQLISAINDKINENTTLQNKIVFSHNSINNKITIKNQDTNDMTFNWYITSDRNNITCGASGLGAGGKIDYNFGWLLGFRTSKSFLPGNSDITATSLVNLHGPKYFLITLDDFNNNKPNKDLISFVDTTVDTFKLPEYINLQTMDSRYGIGKYYPGKEGISGYECQDVADVENNKRGCSTDNLNLDLSSNLTQAQQYTAEQIKLARQQNNVNRYTSPNSTDLLARISINRTPEDWTTNITYTAEPVKRRYFGPVKLSKFKVRLLNDKGFEVNLNDMDWSFSIIITQLYQF